MPTVLRVNGYKAKFYSNDHDPAHVHVEKAEKSVKIELGSWEVVENFGFVSREIRQIINILKDNEDTLWEAWYEFFGS